MDNLIKDTEQAGVYDILQAKGEDEKVKSSGSMVSVAFGPSIKTAVDVVRAGKYGYSKVLDKEQESRKGRVKIEYEEKTLSENGNLTRALTVTRESPTDFTILDISNLDLFRGYNIGIKKMFVFITGEMEETVLSNGELVFNTMTIPLKVLVDKGLYSSVDSAENAMSTFIPAALSISMYGETKHRGKKSSIKSGRALFPALDVKDGKLYISFNPYVNWPSLCQYYCRMPSYTYSLPVNSFDLLYYIFYMANIRAEEILEKGYFDLTFRSIHASMQLPEPKDISHPQRDIKEPLKKAIDTILRVHKEKYGNDDIKIEKWIRGTGQKLEEGRPMTKEDDKLTTNNWLDRCYIRVYLSGDFVTSFNRKVEHKRTKIQQAVKRKEQARLNALERYEYEKLKEDEQAGVKP